MRPSSVDPYRRGTYRPSSRPSSSMSVRTAEREERENLEGLLRDAVMEFEVVSTAAGLPWIDKRMYRQELLAGATVTSLSRIQRLNDVLRTQAALSAEILRHCKKREEYVCQLMMSCAFPQFDRQCCHESHQEQCSTLRRVDDETDQIIALIKQWRVPLAAPTPFFFEGENYLLRMAAQTKSGAGLAQVGSHLRNTCRHLPFFYPSSYDPFVVESNNILARDELETLRCENSTQLQYCTDALQLSRTGNYLPLLRFRHAPGRATRPILIDNKQWKHQLILSYTSALAMLNKTKPQDDSVTSAMLQFVGMVTKALHREYYSRWLQWWRWRVERRVMAEGSATMSEMLLRQRYYLQWSKYVFMWRQKYCDLDSMQVRNVNRLRLRYFRTLRNRAMMCRLEHSALQKLRRKYFLSLLYEAVVALCTAQKAEAAKSDNIAPPLFDSLHRLALIGGNNLVYLQAVVTHSHQPEAIERSLKGFQPPTATVPSRAVVIK